MKSLLFIFVLWAETSCVNSALWEYLHPRCYFPEKCYSWYGCFANDEPFNNALCKMPESPEEIGLQLKIFRHKNDTDPIVPHIDICLSYYKCPVDRTKKITFIIHGFTDSTDSAWMNEMKDALLAQEDMTVVLVDWNEGAKFPYEQAAANTRLVARMLAFFIDDLHWNGMDFRDVHLIGHSLGAHIAGQVGSDLGGVIGRITGLDPAGPYFDRDSPLIRLDRTDAHFVDTIHSDGEHLTSLGFGMMRRMGHADFYPEGGFEQAECPKNVFQTLLSLFGGLGEFKKKVACSHNRAPQYFINSITNCDYWSSTCWSYRDYLNNKCVCTTSKQNCNQMGYHADPNKHGIFYIYVAGGEPYCAATPPTR